MKKCVQNKKTILVSVIMIIALLVGRTGRI